jgi:hypothetical protein
MVAGLCPSGALSRLLKLISTMQTPCMYNLLRPFPSCSSDSGFFSLFVLGSLRKDVERERFPFILTVYFDMFAAISLGIKSMFLDMY